MKRIVLLFFLIISLLGKVDVGHAKSLDFIISLFGEDLYDYFGWSCAPATSIAMGMQIS